MLGGGVGGLTAAFELTRPEHRGRFDVTVYQLGWRLGGKGASGRNLKCGARIEEHGLHVWFGFYANAFRLMHDVYRELQRPSTAPLATVGEAFQPCPKIGLFDRIDGGWHSHSISFPDCGEDPWKHEPNRLPNVFAVAGRALRWTLRSLDQLTGLEVVPADARRHLQKAEQQAADLEHQHQEGLSLELAQAGLERILAAVRPARESLRNSWAPFLTGAGLRPRLRLIFTTLDMLLAAGTGIAKDDVLKEGFEVIDGWDLARWLECHGASSLTIGANPAERAPALRAVYDVAFCFPDGDISKASAAAGTATSDLLKLLFAYRGQLAYKMTAGMGDAIFAPLYQVLRKRHVTFRFFHAVTDIRPSKDSEHAVDEIDLVPQLNLGHAYEPLVTVGALPCWPNLPLWDQLPAGTEPYGTRFETELDPCGRKSNAGFTLRHGIDFHKVVLGIPVGALGGISGELMRTNKPFRKMVEGSATVQTQAFQLWTRKPPEELGANHGNDSVAACFVEPLDTYCDMGHLHQVESWRPDDGVRGIVYVCGVLKHIEGETAAQATERVRQNALEYLRFDAQHLFPELDEDVWTELADRYDRKGEARFDSQYWRANTAGWERYVITPAGNVASRLPSERSGFANLVLAGDWTKNGINGGCVEAAVISGMQAARALTGKEAVIVGEDPHWLTGS